MEKPLRILIVDDSLLFRKVIRDALNGLPGCEVVGVCNNGNDALTRLELLKPDLVTLDIEMPGKDGLEVLEAVSKKNLDCGVIMLSNLTSTGAKQTNRALELGAFDFVLKPQSRCLTDSVQKLKRDLIPRVKAFQGVSATRLGRSPFSKVNSNSSRTSRSNSSLFAVPSNKPRTPLNHTKPSANAGSLGNFKRPSQTPAAKGRATCTPAKAVAIGISTGGPKALLKVLPEIPEKFPVPIFIVQHMPPVFTRSLAESLNPKCRVDVCEAEDGMVVKPGVVYIAPGGKQMKVVQSDLLRIEINNDPPENSSRPSVDYLFRNLAHLYGRDLLSVVMTGMGADGTSGAGVIKEQGGRVISQDEASSTVYGMPKAVYEAGFSESQHSLNDLSSAITNSVRGVSSSCV